MALPSLTAISPLDGRYANKTSAFGLCVSEFGLIRYRLIVEAAWLETLANEACIAELPALPKACLKKLNAFVAGFSAEGAQAVKDIEKTTNHDVKAVEYYLKAFFEKEPDLAPYIEFIHFACTSEDINNLAYGLMIQDVKTTILLPTLNTLLDTLHSFAKNTAELPMLSRTHGQTASPTTLGKEFANIAHRLKREINTLRALPVFGKINGATGNFNAHVCTYPEVDWQRLAKQFVESLGLQYNSHTTQIEPHDYMAEHFHALARINTILLDFSRDIWSYISLNYFTQKLKDGEVGSSTMPHKVNPIDFENAEGNLGIANALLLHFASKLPISRWQRDLSDSTVLRNLGVAFAHSELSYQALLKGMGKLQVNETIISDDLANHWEVLGEALQTIMRRYGIEKPYEKLKALTRGKTINAENLQAFIKNLALPEAVKTSLLELTPGAYIGYAAMLAKQ